MGVAAANPAVKSWEYNAPPRGAFLGLPPGHAHMKGGTGRSSVHAWGTTGCSGKFFRDTVPLHPKNASHLLGHLLEDAGHLGRLEHNRDDVLREAGPHVRPRQPLWVTGVPRNTVEPLFELAEDIGGLLDRHV
eukprot:CAMPEP_0177511222 /NCGR_PEP_ID=MMETSP0369-20130122/42558_1 /TAXON_ID=447022 ORGANISM="Scrippsiella hangoei-like, Strain SHHI-4" /NCGR_SAMPLE_ID=MMETSP0369 /ASSEMBLY_ACC=CAM_ASM_000364 /LENGTH=132 /DNA_ID=CAMNT_0018989611 /DNA_START=114 /DNA_END=509 /DNA_ORIENTATION=+